jgi:hypothetical protein
MVGTRASSEEFVTPGLPEEFVTLRLLLQETITFVVIMRVSHFIINDPIPTGGTPNLGHQEPTSHDSFNSIFIMNQ